MRQSKLAQHLKQTKPFKHIEEELSLLLVKTSNDVEYALTNVLKPEGLSGAQYNILRILRGSAEDGLACRELSKRLLVKAPDITRLLDRLETHELICRQRATHDRRIVTARITNKGLEVLERLEEPLSTMQQQQFQSLKTQEKEQLIQLLNKLYKVP